MQRSGLRWPRVRPLVVLLQSPAHRVMRVLHVTQSHWLVEDKRGARRCAATKESAAPSTPRPSLSLLQKR
jgi:hypothetical protein